MTFMQKVDDCIENTEWQSELAAYAAVAALKELSTNWSAAIHDGAEPKTLIADIDATVSYLLDAKRRLTSEALG